MKLDPYLIPLTKINSKWIKELNLRPKTIKLLEEKIGENLLSIGLSSDFLDMTAKAQATKAKINKWDYITLNSFCTEKETIKKLKRQLMKWDRIFANYISDKELIPKVHKEHIQLNSKKKPLKTQLKNGQRN